MGQFSLAKLFGMTIRESANDGSDFSNPDADFRRLFLGEDGQLHVKDSAGTVTDIGSAASPPDCEEAFCSSNTAIGSANTWTDVTGMSMSLAAGTWDVQAYVYGSDSSGTANSVGIGIHNGTSVVSSSGTTRVGSAGVRFQVGCGARITLGGTTTVKVQALSSTTTTTILTSETFSGVGVANTACRVRAIKVTGI